MFGYCRSTKYVHIYLEYHSVCPLVEIGTPHPLSHECAPPPPPTKGGGHTRLRVREWRSPNSDDWRKSLALCLLCVYGTYKVYINFRANSFESLCKALIIVSSLQLRAYMYKGSVGVGHYRQCRLWFSPLPTVSSSCSHYI
jgi:hypothetical protein